MIVCDGFRESGCELELALSADGAECGATTNSALFPRQRRQRLHRAEGRFEAG